MKKTSQIPTPFKIALRYFTNNTAKTVITVFVVAMAVSMVYSTTAFSLQSRKNIEKVINFTGADMVVVPHGTKNAFENTLLLGKPSSMYMDEGIYDRILRIDHVQVASPQLYAVSLSETLACCGLPDTQIVGIDPGTDFIVSRFLPEGFRLENGECITGFTVVGDVGQTLPFFGKNFRIRYRLPYTNTLLDYVVIVRIDDLRKALSTHKFSDKDYAGLISAIFIKVDDPKYIDYVAMKLHKMGLVDVVTKDSITSSAFRILEKTSESLKLYTGMTLILSAVAISGVLISGVDARKKEIALLKALGIKDSQIFRIFIYESAILTVSGWLPGMILGSVILRALSQGSTIGQVIYTDDVIFMSILGGLMTSALISLIPGIYSLVISRKINPSGVIRN